MHRTHRIRLYPTKEQEALLIKSVGTRRYTYNWGLVRWEEEYNKGNEPTFGKIDAIWTKERPAWTRETSRALQTKALRELEQAWKAYFKKNAGKPKLHKKGVRDSFYLTNDRTYVFEKEIRLAHIGRVKMAEPLRFDGKILGFVVSAFAGKWYVNVQLEVPTPPLKCTNASVVGVDVGMQNPGYASDGTKIVLPKKLSKYYRNLQRKERALARSIQDSKNYDKKFLRIQKIQDRINNIKIDVTHKFTTTVCKNHATVVIEDLDIRSIKDKLKHRAGLTALHRSLMRTVLDQLSYKATNLIKAPRYYPSSKTCSKCGFINPNLTLRDRTYKCPRCGAVLDRDYNAALNLMKLGLVKPE